MDSIINQRIDSAVGRVAHVQPSSEPSGGCNRFFCVLMPKIRAADVKSNNAKSAPFDWKNATSRWTTTQSEALAQEWGLNALTLDQLCTRGYIGYCISEKFKERCFAIPFRDADGEVFRAQCRAPKRDQNGHASWVYEPLKDPLERQIPPWIVGDPGTAARVFVFESQHDLIAFVDKGEFMYEIDEGEMAFISTCGAAQAGKLETIGGWAENVEIFLVPQNDEPGQKLLAKALYILSGFEPRVLAVPPPHKDFAEWAQTGLTCDQLYDLIEAAPKGEAPQPEGKKGTHQAGKEKKYEPYQPKAILLLAIINAVSTGKIFYLDQVSLREPAGYSWPVRAGSANPQWLCSAGAAGHAAEAPSILSRPGLCG